MENATHLVNHLQPGVVLQRLKRGAVALPEELEPRRDERAVCAILALVAADGAKEDAFRRLSRLQVVNVGKRDSLFRLRLRRLHLRVCKLDEAVDDDFDRADVGVLGNVLVLHETLLGSATLAHVDAKLDEADHDRFERRKRRGPEALGGEHLRERLERGVRLPNGDEALRLLEDRLRFRKRGHLIVLYIINHLLDSKLERRLTIVVYGCLRCSRPPKLCRWCERWLSDLQQIDSKQVNCVADGYLKSLDNDEQEVYRA